MRRTCRRPDLATACIRIAASVMPRPAPPDASGIAMPSQLPSAMAAKKASGKVAVRVTLQPVGVVETAADLQYGFPDVLLILRER